MIKQAPKSTINSRSECNPYNEQGFLPIITAPMYTIVDDTNYQVFLDNKIQVCLPRGSKYLDKQGVFISYSLVEFINNFSLNFLTKENPGQNDVKHYVCIDTANGNMSQLHDAIRKAKEIYGNNLIIMAGNVASAEAFVELAKTGVDYIRVGIGGGCLAADTRILMANGTYKNIVDIQIGDYVINKDGNPVKVINTFYSGKKKVSKVKHNAFYNSLTITNDHLVRVSDLSSYKKSSVSSKGYKAFFKKDSWKPVSESINDNLLSPTKINYQLQFDFNINLNQFDSDKSKNVVGNIKPSYELGYIFGTFLGDGDANVREDFFVKRNSINKTGSVHWTFGKNEDSIALTLIEYIEDIFKEESGYRKEDNIIKVNLYRKWVAQLFSEFYTEDGTKYLPNKWYCLNDDYLKGLYDGLIDSDGYKEVTRDCFENTSPYLIELIYFIKSNLQGYFPNTEQRKKTCGKLKNCNDSNLKQSYSLRTLSNYLTRQTEKFNLLKITSFENGFDEIDTYDIEVDCPTHSFIANNCIVHNSGCNTTSNTGIGQEDLEELIKQCLIRKNNYKQHRKDTYLPHKEFNKTHGFVSNELKQMWTNISSVKIIADGISTYVKQCETKYGFNDNGYAAINKLLYAGADLVMVGKLFAQCLESAGEKAIYKHTNNNYVTIANDALERRYEMYKDFNNCYVKYSGMSTHQAQKQYRNDLKPSEGSIKWIPVRFLLKEWIWGNESQDTYPYLMGFANSLKSAMSYTDSLTLNDFKQ